MAKTYLVGYVGTMSVQDGLDILVDVALHMKNLGRRDIHFTCVGGGPGLAGLRKMVKDKDLGDTINFTGRIPDEQLLEILSTADVCVNPDKPCEMNDISTMIKIMEYMALGKPIVQFDLNEGRFSAQDAAVYADTDEPGARFCGQDSRGCSTIQRREERWVSSDAGGWKKSLPGNTPSRICSQPTKKLSARCEASTLSRPTVRSLETKSACIEGLFCSVTSRATQSLDN